MQIKANRSQASWRHLLLGLDNIQTWRTPFPIWNQSVVPCPVLTVASWPTYRFLKKQVRWSSTFTETLLWTTIWSILENVPWALEDVFCCFHVECSLYVYIKFIWSSMSFKASVSVLIFFVWMICPQSGGVKVPYYYCVAVNFSFYIH